MEIVVKQLVKLSINTFFVIFFCLSVCYGKPSKIVGLVQVRNDDRAWLLLGQAYLYDKQYAKAAPFLDKYARAHTDSSAAWYNLGVSYSRSSQWKPAAEALEQTLKLAPTNVAAGLELGYVYESDKQFDKALAVYEKTYEASGRRDETARAGIDRLKQTKPQAKS